MNFFKYLASHFLLSVIVFCIGYYVCKQMPNLFGNLPLLGTG